MLRSSSLTPLRSKLGDLADFLQRKLLNGDLLRLRSLRLKVPDSLPLPPLGAFNTTHATRAIMLLATYTSHREPIFILYTHIYIYNYDGRRVEGENVVKFVEILFAAHATCPCEIYFLSRSNSGKKESIFEAFLFLKLVFEKKES